MRNALIAAVMLVAALPAMAQEAAAPDPCVAGARASFDVVSIKPSQRSSRSSSFRGTQDGFTSAGSLRSLMMIAYGLRDFQVEGGPDWVTDATWEIAAKLDPPDADPSKLDKTGRKAWSDRQSQRIQALLIDRFQLKCHIATKELPVYDLVVAKGGSKLIETKVEESKRNSIDGEGRGLRNRTVGTGVDMKSLTEDLSGELDRTVVDQTGLTGSYDFTLNWMSDDMHASTETDAPAGPTIFTAIEEQLGLKLVPTKGPVPVLVIDAVEKPSEN